MKESYKNKLPLESSDTIGKKSSSDDFFSEYPIIVENINFYEPIEVKGTTAAAQISAKIAANMSKPAIFLLMVVAMPAAIALQKAIFSLDYLDFLNIRDMPPNIS